MIDFPAERDGIFVTSYLIFQHLNLFFKGVYSKRKEFAAPWIHIFPTEQTSFQEGKQKQFLQSVSISYLLEIHTSGYMIYTLYSSFVIQVLAFTQSLVTSKNVKADFYYGIVLGSLHANHSLSRQNSTVITLNIGTNRPEQTV